MTARISARHIMAAPLLVRDPQSHYRNTYYYHYVLRRSAMPVSTLTSKYQATIPRAVREALTLGAGDRIEFIIERDGVRVRRALPADPELQELEATLAPEWDSAGDEAAYADL